YIQRAVFGTQLAFDATGLVLSGTALGLSITAGAAGYIAANTAVAATAATAGAVATGAATAGALIGGAGVIVAGLGIGAAALAQNYSIIAEQAAAIGKMFKAIDDGYKGGGFELCVEEDGTNILRALNGAVVNQVNFRDNTVGFGNHYMNQTLHGPTGSGKIDYFFWSNDAPRENTHAQLNIREELGYGESATLRHAVSRVMILPATPETHLSDYDYQTLPGATTRTDAGFDVLRKLEDNYLFDFDYYTFPSEYILQRIDNRSYAKTAVQVYLDDQNRTFLMSEIPSEYNGKVRYEFHGQGGEYVLALNEGFFTTLRNDGETPSTWIFDMSNLDRQDVRFRGNTIDVGGHGIYLANTVRQNTLLVVNRDRDLYSIDLANRTTHILSANGDAFETHAALVAHVQSLRYPGRFLTVNNYTDVHGTRMGRAWYDNETSTFRTARTHSVDMTENLNLIYVDDEGGKVYYTAQANGKMEVWEVNGSSMAIERRFSLAQTPSRGSQRLSGVWHDGNQLILEQTETRGSVGIQRRYRLTDEGLKLVTVMGDDAHANAWRSGSLPTNWFSTLRASGTPISWTPTTPVNIGTHAQATAEEWVGIMGSSHRLWINASTRERVVPVMDTIPDDLQFLGRDTSVVPAKCLFYSAGEKVLYRQDGNGLSWLSGGRPTLVDGDFESTTGWSLSGDAARALEPGSRVNHQLGLSDGSAYQSLYTLRRGGHYAIRFDVGGGSSTQGTGVLNIYWNGSRLGQIDWSAGMVPREFNVVANGNHDSLLIEVDPASDAVNPPRFFVDNVFLSAHPVREYQGVNRLISLGTHPIFETLNGEIRQMESTGETRLVGVNEQWLTDHPNRTAVVRPDLGVLAEHSSHAPERPSLPTPMETTEELNWREDLRRLARREGIHADSVLTINGITNDGGTNVPAWYDVTSDRFIIAPVVTTGALIYLGLTGDKTRALFYNAGAKEFYAQSLLNDTQLDTLFGTDHVLEATAVIPSLSDIFEGTGITVDNVVPHDGNQYLATTTNGLAFLVGKTTTPSLAAVLDSWTGTTTQLEALFTTWHHEDVVRVLRRASNGVEIQNWWLSDSRKWASLSGRERDEMEFVGESADRSKVYVFDKTAGELIELTQSTTVSLTTASAGRVIDTAASVQRFTGDSHTLYLKGADVTPPNPGEDMPRRNLVPPVLYGVSSLGLSGGNGADQFMISQSVWDHYSTIVVDCRDGSAMDTVSFGDGINAAHMTVSRDDDGGLVIWEAATGKRLVLRGVLSEDASQRALYQNIRVKFYGMQPMGLSSLIQSVQGSVEADTIRRPDESYVIRGGRDND
ncbi:MAG: hypothetical protein MI749_05760, partial [Desulfovibrionales bacterium]|nr:hypothetical protein [Desulfovibrionales bacterium]